MKPTYFSNKKSLEIISKPIKDDIKKLISCIGSFNLTSKYYTFLNKKNVNNLKEQDFLVTLSTFGKKFILFNTTYNTKKYCIFINKKNDTMTVTQLKFSDDIFDGTLFDGELIKNSNDKWIYLINDIAYYKGKNIVMKSFAERQSIIDNILKNEHDNDQNDIKQTFYISKKNYFRYENIKNLVDKYMILLNYKCSGLYFKNINNFSDNYLFIFPECRSDNITDSGTVLHHSKQNSCPKDSVKINDDDIDDLFKNVEIIKMPVKEVSDDMSNKTTCNFIINKTLMPDIYELFYKCNNNKIEKYSYASVPDIETSNFIKDIFINTSSNNIIYVECKYHKEFKKWIPFKKVDSVDSNSTINKIQNILDSL